MTNGSRVARTVVSWFLFASACVFIRLVAGCAHQEKAPTFTAYSQLLNPCIAICHSAPVAACQAMNGEIGCVCPQAPGKRDE